MKTIDRIWIFLGIMMVANFIDKNEKMQAVIGLFFGIAWLAAFMGGGEKK